MNWMFLPLKRYADFQGRSRRLEYWMFALFQVIVATVLTIAFLSFAAPTTMAVSEGALDQQEAAAAMAGSMSGFVLLFCLVWAALIIPSLAVTVRRFHDQDKSGWMILLGLIPAVGGIILLVFMLLPGTPGANRYGPDPTEAAVAESY